MASETDKMNIRNKQYHLVIHILWFARCLKVRNLLVMQHQSVVSFACCFQYALHFSRQKYTTVIHLLACKPFYTLSHKEGHIILENPVIWISKNLEARQFETNIFHGLVTFFLSGHLQKI